MKFKSFYLTESIELPEIWYHGSKKDFDKFDLNFAITKESNAEVGPGFYLTTDKEDAHRYGIINKEESGYLKEVKLTKKSGIKNENQKYQQSFAQFLINRMPNKQDVLSNWDENKYKALNILTSHILESSDTLKEMILNIWADCYKDEEQDLMRRLRVKGIDGLLIKKNNGVKWLVCYNPDILKIVKNTKL